MSAAAFRERLRDDLKAAMRARNEGEVRVLRALGAAIDNAQAVQLGDEALRRFSESEIARRELTNDDIAELLAREHSERLEAAAEFERLGQAAEAERLRGEAAAVARYA
ncbi:MAG: GatB/YqeY domain-containing protein [Croceibacterium sp.]